MHVKEIWRYPVKSMAGESLDLVHIDELGLADDRKVLVCDANGRVLTSRTHHKLLGLKGSLGADGQAHIDGHLWNAPEALALVRGAAGPAADLIHYEGPERFDVGDLLRGGIGFLIAGALLFYLLHPRLRSAVARRESLLDRPPVRT